MKKLIVIFLLISVNHTFAQFSCDSINFTSTSESVNLPTNDQLSMSYTFDSSTTPLIVYPFYYIVLNDTTEVVVRHDYVGSFLGDTDPILFTVIYKNPSTPDGYTVTGTFDIHDPNANPTFLCQFPFTLTVNNQSSSLEENSETKVSIFPNPTQDNVMIHSETEIQEVTVINTLGQELLRFKEVGKTDLMLDLSTLDSGCYRVVIHSEDGISSSSILRE